MFGSHLRFWSLPKWHYCNTLFSSRTPPIFTQLFSYSAGIMLNCLLHPSMPKSTCSRIQEFVLYSTLWLYSVDWVWAMTANQCFKTDSSVLGSELARMSIKLQNQCGLKSGKVITSPVTICGNFVYLITVHKHWIQGAITIPSQYSTRV